jgi:hypothetical protein
VVSGRSLFALEIKTKYDCFQITWESECSKIHG